MLSFLPGFILFPFSFLLYCLNLTFNGAFITLGGLLKLLIPLPIFHRKLLSVMHFFYRFWSFNNYLIMSLTNKIEWQIKGDLALNKNAWYLLIANHQSWLDIFVIMHFLRKRTAEGKFFLKEELRYIPFIGSACWALDMPFMKRYSRAFIEKNPHLKGQDIEATRKSCEKYRDQPTTIINFVEGTRFTEEKHKSQQSKFPHLLNPRAGGIAFTLASMGEQFDKIIDITLVYPENSGHVMKDLLKGKVTKIIIEVNQIDINEDILGNYFEDDSFKDRFQQWLNKVWERKNKLIENFYNM